VDCCSFVLPGAGFLIPKKLGNGGPLMISAALSLCAVSGADEKGPPFADGPV
jgi:hypothetical protein